MNGRDEKEKVVSLIQKLFSQRINEWNGAKKFKICFLFELSPIIIHHKRLLTKYYY